MPPLITISWVLRSYRRDGWTCSFHPLNCPFSLFGWWEQRRAWFRCWKSRLGGVWLPSRISWISFRADSQTLIFSPLAEHSSSVLSNFNCTIIYFHCKQKIEYDRWSKSTPAHTLTPHQSEVITVRNILNISLCMTQIVIPGAAAAAFPGNLLEMQILDPIPDLMNQTLGVIPKTLTSPSVILMLPQEPA